MLGGLAHGTAHFVQCNSANLLEDVLLIDYMLEFPHVYFNKSPYT